MDNILLGLCALLVLSGLFTIALSSGFFDSLFGAGMLATGGSAAYLILSHRADAKSRESY